MGRAGQEVLPVLRDLHRQMGRCPLSDYARTGQAPSYAPVCALRWLWFALSPNPGTTSSGTGDYAGSDCGHGEGAVADKGDVTWTKAGGTLTITGVKLNGLGGLPVTITVHSAYSHYSTDVVSVFPTLGGAPLFLPPGVGFSQVQVAP